MNKLEQAARQALEALEIIKAHSMNWWDLDDDITALREALAGVNMSPTEQAEQEPVATVVRNKFGVISLQAPNGGNFNLGKNVGMKLYAAPVRTKDLTDDEIDEIFAEHGTIPNTKAVRSVIAADREKNK